ncbi:MAG TPA: hypothetical protein VIA06_07145 [Candidatus Dormibacteraeota bacterium]|jgi:hypothetical protein|nr:hypothetical protein [Candidatus Dormibacteraeota bacterium]
MTRYVHYVGSLPRELMTGFGDQMTWFVDHSQGHPLTGVPCDLDADWIIDYLRERERHADVLEVVRGGDFSDYSDMRSYGIRRGAKLEPRHVSMDRVDRIREVVAAYRQLQAAHPELKDTKIQISQPLPIDLALFVFAGAAVTDGLPIGRAVRHLDVVMTALRQLPVFVEAMLEEIRQLHQEHGDILKWQVETPIAQLGMVKAAQLGAQGPAASLLSRQLGSFLARVHEIGAETVIHLCYGNYRKKELLSPRDLSPAVNLLNPTGRMLRRQGVPLPALHIPCAYGASPSPLEESFYRPLRRLDPEWKLIAGVVSETSEEGSARSLALFEEASGRTAHGVATTCGLGRCTVEDAEKAAAATVATADAPGGEEEAGAA